MTMNAASLLGTSSGSADNLQQGGIKLNNHWHDADYVELTNRTGGGLVAGDVVRLSGTNVSSVVAGDTPISHRPFVIAAATIADTALGKFARSGYIVAKCTGSFALGDYVRKSNTAKCIETTGVAHTNTGPMPDGALGFTVGAAAGGFVLIYLFPVTMIKSNNLLIASGTDQVIMNTTTETDITGSMASVLANTLSIVGGIVLVELVGAVQGTSVNGSQVFTFRLKFGATTVCSKAVRVGTTAGAGLALATPEPFVIRAHISGHGATNDQRGQLTYHGREVNSTGTALIDVSPAVARGSSAEDTTATKTIKVTAQCSIADPSVFAVVELARVTQPPT